MFIAEGAKQKLREVLLEDEVCGAVLVLNKPWSAAACSGKGFLLGAIWL